MPVLKPVEMEALGNPPFPVSTVHARMEMPDFCHRIASGLGMPFGLGEQQFAEARLGECGGRSGERCLRERPRSR